MIPISILSIGFLLYAIPRVTRPGLLFAVTVDPAFLKDPAARRIVRRYDLQIALHSVLALAIGFALGPAGGVLWLMFGGVWAFVNAHRASTPCAAAETAIRDADLTPRSEDTALGASLALAPLALLALLAWYAGRHWDLIPSQVPVHFGLHGADRWLERTPRAVYGMILLHATLCLTLILLRYGLLHASRRVAVGGEAAEAESRFRRIVLWLLIAVEYHIAALAWVVLFSTPRAAAIWGIGMAVLLGAAVIAMLRLGQGGSRQAAGSPACDRTPDSCWKWGLFYVNPNDPALFVEKRFGLGYTVNLGHQQRWVVLAITLLPLVICYYLLR